ncbi:unnamed protein product [Brachionus calyciflorus]|uniref:Rad17 n=1 Tax=Brachionus calyciflorus TaxID=104777 RepID=A0A813X1K2_9BILA|nr:unnamed protein product [Brachionus calyciflorus]
MKSWVSSAFSDSAFANTTKPTRTTRASSQKQTLSNLTNKEPKAKISEPFNSPAKKQKENTLSLSLKYEPTTRADLSVHKNKIDQLSNLLDQIISKERGSILLIEGPSGCGKYITLKVLCKEKGVELVEWDPSNVNLKSFDLQIDGEYNEPYESQIKNFSQYLFKSSRYESNQLFNNDKSTQNVKKVMLVKEIPNFAFRDPKIFVNLLNDFKRFSKFSLIFSLTQTTYSSDINPQKIFPTDIRKDLKCLEISFNSIANTFMNKKIEKIAKMEHFGFVDKKFLENLCSTSNGDLRHAINLVELTSTGHKVQFTQKKISKTKTGEAINFDSGSKDANYSIFRGLGKILHRKNVDNNFEEFKMPKHLVQYKRPVLSADPEDIYDKLPLSSDLILSYLHQNYIDIFNIKSSSSNFDCQFEALDSINDSFIMSDIINKTSCLFESGTNTGTQEARLKEISASISIRSVLFNFYFSTENESKSLWMPLFKPFNSKLIEAKLKRKKMARDFLNLAIENNSNMIKYLIEMNKEFFIELIPFVQLRSTMRRPPGQQRDNLVQMMFKPEFTQLFSKCTKTRSNQQQTTENDYENQQDEQDENVLLNENKPYKKESNVSNSANKGNYEYEDASGLKIEDFNF